MLKVLKKIKIFSLIFAAFLCVAVLFVAKNQTNPVFAANDSQQQIYELENQLSSLQKDAAGLKKQVDAAKNNLKSAENEIAYLDQETSNLETQIDTLGTLLEQWQGLSDQLNTEIAQLESEYQSEQKMFDNMLRMSYQYGSDTYFNLIFGSESISDFLSRIDLIVYHLKYNNNVIENLVTTQQTLEQKKTQFEQSTEKLAEYKELQQNNKVQLEEKLETVRVKKAQYASDAKNAEALYKKKLEETNKINAEIKELYEQQRKNDTTTYTGTLSYPLPSSYKRISSGFVNRISPISGKRENHNGLDLPAPKGTPIYAADGGTVVIAKYSSSWGNYVTINHGGGMMTLYAHASSLKVKAGQTVKKGDTIALVGSTGWSTGNHLHFTVYKKGVAVNPAPYIGL